MLSKHCKSEKLVKNKISYEDIFKDTNKQKNVTDLFMQLLEDNPHWKTTFDGGQILIKEKL